MGTEWIWVGRDRQRYRHQPRAAAGQSPMYALGGQLTFHLPLVQEALKLSTNQPLILAMAWAFNMGRSAMV